MNALIRSLTCLCLLLASAAARCEIEAPSSAAEAAARTFYAWVLANPSAGVPAPEQLAELQPLLSPPLHAALQAAASAQAECERSAEADEKPLMLEGDLFVGSYEGATEVVIETVRVDGERAEIFATLVYLDLRFPAAHPYRAFLWRDRLQLARADGSWRVADVYPHTGQNLVAALQSFLEQSRLHCHGSR